MSEPRQDWYTDEAFWVTSYPFLFPEDRHEAADAEVANIVALSGREHGSLLDLCCGPGRHAIRFAKRGFSVTGVDATPFLLDKARAAAQEEGIAVEWVESDMREFVRPGSYDLAVNLFTSFGFFDDPSDNRRVLEHLFASLRSGGIAVLDMLGKEVLASIFEPSDARKLSDGSVLVQFRRVRDGWRRIDAEWLLIRDGSMRRFASRLWLYSGHELEQLLSEVGFEQVELYGDLAGSTYGPGATRLVAVARKA